MSSSDHVLDGEHSDDHGEHFSVMKIFITLCVLTAAEVIYGEIGNKYFYEKKVILWGGLMLFAVWKGVLIFRYFMHMKYEKSIVKGNVWFTVPLVIYFMTILLTEIGYNDYHNYGIGEQQDPETGEIISIGEGSRNKYNAEYAEHYGEEPKGH